MTSMSPDDLYGSEYYASYLGEIPYSWDQPEWQQFFRGMARRLVDELGPTSTLDAGCAKGFLVAALRELGVAAEGFDISDFAVSDVPEAATGHVRVGSLLEPIDGRFDLITCIEVLEHIPSGRVQTAIDSLCGATDLVILSSTPEDFKESTHINVRRPEEWAADFARRGFFRRRSLDVSFISPWAVAFERRHAMQPASVVFEYEGALGPAIHELAVKRTELESVQEALNSERAARAADMPLADVLAKAQQQLQLADQLIGLRAENDELRFRLAQAQADRDPASGAAWDLRQTETWKIGNAVLAPVRGVRRARAFAERAARSARRRWRDSRGPRF